MFFLIAIAFQPPFCGLVPAPKVAAGMEGAGARQAENFGYGTQYKSLATEIMS